MTAAMDDLGGCQHFQLGYVVREIDAAIASFEAAGARRIDRIIDMRDGEGREVMIRNLSHLKLGNTEIELIEPRDDWPSVYENWISEESDVRLHHLGFMARNDAEWDAAIAKLSDSADIVMEIDLPQVRVAYFDTRARFGHYLEIVQRPVAKTTYFSGGADTDAS